MNTVASIIAFIALFAICAVSLMAWYARLSIKLAEAFDEDPFN